MCLLGCIILFCKFGSQNSQMNFVYMQWHMLNVHCRNGKRFWLLFVRYNPVCDHIDYLEDLGEQPETATAFTSNMINISGVETSAFQFQQGTEGSSQQQHAEISTNDFNKFCELIETDLKSARITEAIKTEILEELEYAKKQHNRKGPIVEQLKNIGGFIKKIGIGVFTSLAASPLFEIIKPHIGLD